MENTVKGTIKKIMPVQEGTSKAGKEWKKLTFVVANDGGYEGKEQIFAFDLFGEEKVDKFLQYNKVGQAVDVSYNIRTNEWNDKYFTTLDAWKIMKADASSEPVKTESAFETVEQNDSLPF